MQQSKKGNFKKTSINVLFLDLMLVTQICSVKTHSATPFWYEYFLYINYFLIKGFLKIGTIYNNKKQELKKSGNILTKGIENQYLKNLTKI